ncbi:hypothetical protein NONO_c10680 [Nocardia nova SH22a]|uniref:Uncharacterized protein n=1 Tax=Nocardia nova SH22a TaxID=1415166 RepID=W5T992_9NOCA|nr:DUF4267 domain-containing protein [Nocardia nova]AHH15875.1 hypothetical protein NONO_c10680 [Nocardia nova SH22a]
MVSISGTRSSDTTSRSTPMKIRVALTLAGVFSIVVVAFGFIGLFAQSNMLPPDDAVTTGVQFFGALIAARNIPLGLAAIYVIIRRDRVDPTIVLVLSAIVQLGDTVIGLSHGLPSMGISAGVGAILYAFAAVCVSNARRAIRD